MTKKEAKKDLIKEARYFRKFQVSYWRSFLIIAAAAVTVTLSGDKASPLAWHLIWWPFIFYGASVFIGLAAERYFADPLNELEIDSFLEKNLEPDRRKKLDKARKTLKDFYEWVTDGWGRFVFCIQKWITLIGLASILIGLIDLASNKFLYRLFICASNCA